MSKITLQMTDRIEMDAGAQVRFLADGRMVANPRIARTGIQLYRGPEVGKPEMAVVRVYRPEAEVFNDKAAKSFCHVAVTNDHPPEMVTPENFTRYAKGWTGDEVMRDGVFMRVPMMLADAGLINDYKAGKRQLSNGYTCDVEFVAGRTPDGEAYDAIQTGIRGNHVAVVTAARGGSDLRIGDEETSMTNATGTVVIDGSPFVIDATVASVINAHFKRLDDAFKKKGEELESTEEEKKKYKKDLETLTAKAATDAATADAKIKTLEQQLKDATITPAMIDAAVVKRAGIIGKAKTLLGDKLVSKDKTDVEIMRQVVDAKVGDTAKGWNDSQIETSFVSLTANVQADGGGTIDAGSGYRPGFGDVGRGVLDAANAFRGSQNPTVDAVEKAYNDYDKDQSEAWKKPHGVAAGA